MKITKITNYININNISIILVLLLCSSVLYNEIFPSIEQPKTEELTVTLPNLPVHQISSNTWENGFIVDMCDGKNVTPPYIFAQNEENITLQGWAINIDNRESLKNLYLEINGNLIPADYSKVRTDVQSLLGITDSDKIGYTITIEKPIIEKLKGNNKMRFWGICKNEEYMIASKDLYLIIPKPIDSSIPKSSRNLNLHINSITGGRVNNLQKTITLGNSPLVNIHGWAFDNEMPLQAIYLVINNKSYMMNYGMEKEKIKKNFNLTCSNKLGFDITIHKSLLYKEDNTIVDSIELIAISKDGERCESIKYSIKEIL